MSSAITPAPASLLTLPTGIQPSINFSTTWQYASKSAALSPGELLITPEADMLPHISSVLEVEISPFRKVTTSLHNRLLLGPPPAVETVSCRYSPRLSLVWWAKPVDLTRIDDSHSTPVLGLRAPISTNTS